jgi:hypothetical protein
MSEVGHLETKAGARSGMPVGLLHLQDLPFCNLLLSSLLAFALSSPLDSAKRIRDDPDRED